MRKGSWRRRAAWAFAAVVLLALILAFTWRAWTPAAVRLVLKWRGVQVKSVAWEGTNSWKLEGIERAANGTSLRIRSATMLTPWAWKRALREGKTNDIPIFVKVNGWSVILPDRPSSEQGEAMAAKIRRLQNSLTNLQAKCPRAVLLNGALQTGAREFTFGVVDWKNGELAGDFTWPMLNDPAEFRLKILATNKTQLIVRQRGLEIGSRFMGEVLPDGARVAGYARWQSNRCDLDLTFAEGEATPRGGFVESKGLRIPGRFLHLPEIDSINARVRFVITNSQFDFRLGKIEGTSEPVP